MSRDPLGAPMEQSAIVGTMNPPFVDEGAEAQRGSSYCPRSFHTVRDRGPRSTDSKEHVLC